jgi:phage-related tail protein
VLSVVLFAAGSLMLTIAGLAGPFIAWRFAMSSLSIALTSGVGIVGRLGSAIGMIGRVIAFVGRLFLLNPIGLAITVIAGGAYLIWRNWDTLGRSLQRCGARSSRPSPLAGSG